MRKYMANRYNERVLKARELLGGICVVCRTNEELDFDHIDPSTKLFGIADRGAGKNETDFWLEIKKCQLLCRLHHREKSKIDNYRPITHGKMWAWLHNKCHCGLCNKARDNYNTKRRENRKIKRLPL